MDARFSADEHFQRGQEWLQADQPGAALEHFRAAHSLQRDNPRYRSYYGLCVGLVERRFNKALELCGAAVKEEFTNYLIVTVDGRTLTGLLSEQTPRTITLRGIDGNATLVNRDDIDELKAVSTSLMPDGLLEKMNDQQVLDLFSYLTSRTPNKR